METDNEQICDVCVCKNVSHVKTLTKSVRIMRSDWAGVGVGSTLARRSGKAQGTIDVSVVL